MVAFSSPKRSARTVEVAAKHAKALHAEIILMRVIPDPEKVGVVAQLIATDRPVDKAESQVKQVADGLRNEGISARGVVKIGEVAPGILKAALDEQVDMLFVGTTGIEQTPFFLMQKDPIVHYLVDRCPISLCLVRHEDIMESEDADTPAAEE